MIFDVVLPVHIGVLPFFLNRLSILRVLHPMGFGRADLQQNGDWSLCDVAIAMPESGLC